MPVLYSRRVQASSVVSTDGLQTVGTLSFLSPTVIELTSSIYTSPGTYALFAYSTFSGGQAELNAYVTVTHPTLTASAPLDDTVNSRILVTLS